MLAYCSVKYTFGKIHTTIMYIPHVNRFFSWFELSAHEVRKYISFKISQSRLFTLFLTGEKHGPPSRIKKEILISLVFFSDFTRFVSESFFLLFGVTLWWREVLICLQIVKKNLHRLRIIFSLKMTDIIKKRRSRTGIINHSEKLVKTDIAIIFMIIMKRIIY